MGWRFHKSIKLFSGCRMNFSKSGIGLSVGTKGARVSINKNGIRTSVGAGGLYYTEQQSFKNKNNVIDEAEIQREIERQEKIKSMKDYLNSHYTRHRKFIAWGIFCMICGVTRYLPMFIFGTGLTITGILLKIKNKDRIKIEHSK